MRGSIRKRSEKSWTIILDIGRDPETGKRRQQWIAVEGTKKKAETKLTELLGEVDREEYVDPASTTFGQWLDIWFKTAIVGKARPRTVERYQGIIKQHLKPKLGDIPLQKLQASRLETYYAESKLAPAGLELHHTVIRSALASAVRKKLLRHNEANSVDGKPKRRSKNDTAEIRRHCWELEEAQAFLKAAADEGPQAFAFYSVALELGIRKNEIAGLMWKDADLEAGTTRDPRFSPTIGLVHQLQSRGSEPTFGPLKSGGPRKLDLSPGLVEALRAHRSHQAELKLRNRAAYHDHNLVFAKEWKDITHGRAKLGDPLQTNNIGQRQFAKLIKASGVKAIKFHGLRHTAATLALMEGIPVKVVSERLGHSKTSMTLDLYAHALPSMQRDAANRIGALLRG